jgi:hypothetical protein
MRQLVVLKALLGFKAGDEAFGCTLVKADWDNDQYAAPKLVAKRELRTNISRIASALGLVQFARTVPWGRALITAKLAGTKKIGKSRSRGLSPYPDLLFLHCSCLCTSRVAGPGL